MNNLPKAFELIKFDTEVLDEEKNYGKFVIHPLERGFGLTIGNALRRVLISALPGAAVYAVDINGVRHEFEALEGVYEDVQNIILNLKNLIIKVDDDSEEERILEIDKDGPCTVYGKDIKCPALVNILNPDYEIAHLSEGGRLHMNLFIKCGRGFVTAETNKILFGTNNQIGRISTDSNFSPVIKVNYEVEKYRVKSDSNFDQLTLEVWTNGVLKPNEAIANAANILIEHLKLFANVENLEVKKVEFKVPEAPKKQENSVLSTLIEDLELSQRSYNGLKRAKIFTLGDLANKTEEEINDVKNLGKKSIIEIRDTLHRYNLHFRDYSLENK